MATTTFEPMSRNEFDAALLALDDNKLRAEGATGRRTSFNAIVHAGASMLGLCGVDGTVTREKMKTHLGLDNNTIRPIWTALRYNQFLKAREGRERGADVTTGRRREAFEATPSLVRFLEAYNRLREDLFAGLVGNPALNPAEVHNQALELAGVGDDAVLSSHSELVLWRAQADYQTARYVGFDALVTITNRKIEGLEASIPIRIDEHVGRLRQAQPQ